MTCRIFVSYRRDPDVHVTARLVENLERELGRENVFMDVVQGSITPGDDFMQTIKEKIASCELLLAVVGRTWLDARDSAGNRRLDNPSDAVRVEISSAFAQQKRVIPVIVDDAHVPLPDQLPEPLKKLASKQAVVLSTANFQSDCGTLMRQLREILIEEEPPDEEATGKPRRSGSEASAVGAFRGDFWADFVSRYPSELAFGQANRASSRWRVVEGTDFVVVKYLSKRGVGVFVRGPRGADRFEIADQLATRRKQIADSLGAEFNNEQYMFHKWMPCDGQNRANWDRMARWLKDEADRYHGVLASAAG